MNIQHSSRSDRWFTPPYILDLVREVLGVIGLDPASEETANEHVGALRFFTENALSREWKANTVFLNPPGSKVGNQSQSALFWQKLVKEFECGNVKEAIFMGFSVELLAVAQGYGVKSPLEYTICVPAKRIKFIDPTSPGKSSPSHSNVIVYLGPNKEKFCKVFSKLGRCK